MARTLEQLQKQYNSSATSKLGRPGGPGGPGGMMRPGGGPGGKTQTLPVYMYLQAFKSFQLGYGSAISVVLLTLGIAMSVLYTRVYKE